jgi:hypothetical protein
MAHSLYIHYIISELFLFGNFDVRFCVPSEYQILLIVTIFIIKIEVLAINFLINLKSKIYLNEEGKAIS